MGYVLTDFSRVVRDSPFVFQYGQTHRPFIPPCLNLNAKNGLRTGGTGSWARKTVYRPLERQPVLDITKQDRFNRHPSVTGSMILIRILTSTSTVRLFRIRIGLPFSRSKSLGKSLRDFK